MCAVSLVQGAVLGGLRWLECCGDGSRLFKRASWGKRAAGLHRAVPWAVAQPRVGAELVTVHKAMVRRKMKPSPDKWSKPGVRRPTASWGILTSLVSAEGQDSRAQEEQSGAQGWQWAV